MDPSHTETPLLPAEFADIAPYTEDNYFPHLVRLTKEPGFEHAVRFIMPNVDYDAFCSELLSVKSQEDFQRRIMGRFLSDLERLGTAGVTADGIENISAETPYTFISNHRDIVLDPAFLNLVMLRNSLPVTQIAIGNNLLIYDWITDLVKINRSFIVKRDVKKLEALDAARHLSAYIHFAIMKLHESVWIAQRQGRAKDSDDVTQESLVKMLSIAGESGDRKSNLMELNLLPVSISYEFDPNDYLKVREFVMRRRDPEFKKSQRDDLFSMETGMTGYKGRVHYHFAGCVNQQLAAISTTNRNEAVHSACMAIDKEIHSGYYLYPINFIAADIVENTDKYRARYTDDDIATAKAYMDRQLAKVDLPDITPEEHDYMRMMFLTMYANPVRNKEAALQK
ncbi:MAG: acyltransferase [Bacteroidales bacterium]|nr:acyltransferase [Bacteroidales bacterium]